MTSGPPGQVLGSSLAGEFLLWKGNGTAAFLCSMHLIVHSDAESATVNAIAVEDVYDSVFDDDLFRALPARLNRAYDARSCTLHWWHSAGDAEVMAHSGYFSDEQMLNYATNFTHTDLWSLEGLQPSRANQVWNCDDLVPAAHYEASAFYNEWIRAMGDDTFHCIGIAMRTRWGFGFIGLHRGRSQGGFSTDNVSALDGDVVHLRRMLTMRGRLANVRREALGIAAAFDMLGQAVFLVDGECRVRHTNHAAEALLGDGLQVRCGILSARDPCADRALKAAVAKALAASGAEAGAVAIPSSAARQIDLSVIATPEAGGNRLCLLTASHPAARDASVEERLRTLYRLSPGEARLAVLLSEGETPAAIAERRGVAVGTVRAQVKILAAKLGCNRQIDVVRVVKALPPLSVASRG